MNTPGSVGTPIRFFARQVKTLNVDSREENLLSLSYGRVIPKDIASQEGLLPASFERYTVVEPGDTVLRLTDLQNDQRSLRTGLVLEPGIITSAYLTLRPTPEVDSRFFSYALYSLDTAKAFYALGGGLRQSMGMEEVGGLRIDLPPLEEQRRIADFLDDQVATVTTIVSLREQQLALLDASARATLDSSLEPWRHSAPPLRYMTAKIGSGKTPSGGADVYVDHGVAFLRSQNVHNDGLRLHDVAYIDTSTDEEMSATRIQVGDVLLNITGASIGRACWVPSGLGPANVNQHVCIVRPRERISSTLLASALTGGYVQDQIQLSQVGGNRDGLNFEQVASLRIPIPLEEAEQARLADGLSERMQHLQDTKKSLAAAIDALNEYKRSLITGAVTGELDVTTARQEMRV
jgi:type I restriction enzyme S subunit